MVVARLCLFVCLLAHTLALMGSGANPSADPISQLSRGDTVWIHSAGLLALGASWVIIGATSWRRDQSTLWRAGCVLLLFSAALIPLIAAYFATASDARLFGPDANDPLALLASALGVAMGALQPGLRRQSSRLAAVNLCILVLWLGLIPVIPFIEPHWLGAYERTVGVLMLVWTWTLSRLACEATSGQAVRE